MANELLEKRREQMFPKLTQAQLARLGTQGHRLQTRAGEILLDSGARPRGVFIVEAGSLDIQLPAASGYESLLLLTPGDFSGETNSLSDSAALARICVKEGGSVVVIDTEQLRRIIQTDTELSELFMRAFILRRMGLIASGHSEIMLLGSSHSSDTLRLQEFLTRNDRPYVNIDVDAETGIQELLQRLHIGIDDIPVVVCRGERVVKNPSNRALAECLGLNPQLDDAAPHDLVIIGAGPAGLAAAVYAASEGLNVRIVETMAPGGQAGSSSRIENYLGFPTGISGHALASRALLQAQKFGAQLSVAWQAVRLRCDHRPFGIEMADGATLHAQAVLIASGAQYRLPELANLTRFLGAGIYFAATHLEANLCTGEDIAIVGGGNSAGQAAVFLATSCRHVHLLVRADGLADSMSSYLIRRIEDCPNIMLHVRTQITALDGTDRLERISWVRDTDAEQHPVRHVFLMTGARPNTQWLDGCVALDDRGFVKTGPDLSKQDIAAGGWPLSRPPYLLETNVHGVFAAGDVRSGSVKRIASSVGEGSICVQFVHRALHEQAASEPGAGS